MNNSLLKGEWIGLATPQCLLAESPRFAHGHWMWTDIDGQTIYRCMHSDWLNTPQAKIESLPLPDTMGCILPTRQNTVYWLFGRKGAYCLEWPLKQAHNLSPMHTQLFDSQSYRFNDGRADANGRAWVSTLSDARQPGAQLFQIDKKTARVELGDLIVGNGLAFSPDQKTLYLCDTRHRQIWRFDFDVQAGKISHQELMAEYLDGPPRPDGATVTSDGSYVVAVYEGYRLDRYSPSGQLVEQIEVPVAKPTMPCFGGPELDQLLVCSAKADTKNPNKAGFEDKQLIMAHSRLAGIPENLILSL